MGLSAVEGEQIPEHDDTGARGALERSLLDSYRKLAGLFSNLLSEQSLDVLLDEVAEALQELVPYDSLTIYGGDESTRILTPVLARDQWADEVMASHHACSGSASPGGRSRTARLC